MCDICKSSPCACRCPNYIPPKSKYTCSICKEGIQNGEQYFIDDNKDFVHFECFNMLGTRDLINWLGLDVHIMDE